MQILLLHLKLHLFWISNKSRHSNDPYWIHEDNMFVTKSQDTEKRDENLYFTVRYAVCLFISSLGFLICFCVLFVTDSVPLPGNIDNSFA